MTLFLLRLNDEIYGSAFFPNDNRHSERSHVVKYVLRIGRDTKSLPPAKNKSNAVLLPSSARPAVVDD